MLNNLNVSRVATSRLPDVDFENLGFGRVFSDHMFVLDYQDGAWRNPSIQPYGPLAIEPGVASLHYGQSVFEGMKAFRGVDGLVRLFRPDMNAKRLNGSCQRLCIPIIDRDLFVDAIEKLVQIDQRWIPGERGHSLYIRPLVVGCESHLDVRPSEQFKFIIMTCPVQTYYMRSDQGVALLAHEKFTRAAPGGTGFAKTAGNYAASLLPGDLARRQGYDQALWLDGIEHRYVEEVGQMNIFFRLRDKIVTPALRGTILPGVTRDSVITLLRDWGYTVEEDTLAIENIVEAIQSGEMLEVFGVGTAAVVTPVGRIGYRGKDYDIDNRKPGELTGRLYEEITGIQYGEVADPHGWTRIVELNEPFESVA